MTSIRRKFPRDFKLRALRRMEAGESVREVAKSCKIDANVLGRWRRDYEKAPESAFPGPGRPPSEVGIAEFHRQSERRVREIHYLMQRIHNAEVQRRDDDLPLGLQFRSSQTYFQDGVRRLVFGRAKACRGDL